MKTSSLITLFALLFLSGCSVKESAIKPYNYSLEPMVKLERFSTPNNDVLKVARVDTTSGLNSRAILYKKEGAIVNANETIAAVGASGGQSRDGLYFEIRQGKTPQNPARWCR